MTKQLHSASHKPIYRECSLLFCGLAAILLLTHSGFDNSEAVYHYSIAQEILTNGRLSFDHPREGIYTVAPNGRTYASHEIGNTIFLLPVALVNNLVENRLTSALGASKVEMITRFLTASMGAVLCAAGATFLYLTLRLVFAQSARAATLGALMFLFSSFYWSYSRMIFDGVLCSVLLTGGMLFLFLYARDPKKQALLVVAFALLGFGVITRLSMVLPLVAAFIYLLLTPGLGRSQAMRITIVVAMTLAPFACWQMYYNHLRTGHAMTSPVQTEQYAAVNGLTGDLSAGLAGLLFSPGKSIFVYCPIALLSLALIRRFWRAHKNEAVFVCVLSILWLLLHAKLQNWYGAWGWGPRHFVTIAPVLTLPFLVSRLSIRAPFARMGTVILLLFGFLLGAASMISNYHYRLSLANSEGRLDDRWIVWSPNKNQAVDLLVAATRNIQRVFTERPYDIVPGASKLNIEASNTINIWLFTASRSGIPASILTIIAAILTVVSGVSFWLLTSASPAASGERLTHIHCVSSGE